MTLTRESALRALRTFIISFLALFIPSLVGWLNNLLNWANGDTNFPEVDTLSKAAVAAAVAALIGLVNFVWNAVEDNIGKGMLRAVPPKPPKE